MREYQSHKKVKAAQIKSVGEREASGVDVVLEDDTTARLTVEMVARYYPVAGDYLVEYEDNYRSISPQKAFEDGYMAIYADKQK